MYTVQQYEADLRARLSSIPDIAARKEFIDGLIIRHVARFELLGRRIDAGVPVDVPVADYPGLIRLLDDTCKQQVEHQADHRDVVDGEWTA